MHMNTLTVIGGEEMKTLAHLTSFAEERGYEIETHITYEDFLVDESAEEAIKEAMRNGPESLTHDRMLQLMGCLDMGGSGYIGKSLTLKLVDRYRTKHTVTIKSMHAFLRFDEESSTPWAWSWVESKLNEFQEEPEIEVRVNGRVTVCGFPGIERPERYGYSDIESAVSVFDGLVRAFLADPRLEKTQP